MTICISIVDDSPAKKIQEQLGSKHFAYQCGLLITFANILD